MWPDDDDWVHDYTAPISACQDTSPLTACMLANLFVSQKNTAFVVFFHDFCTKPSQTHNYITTIVQCNPAKSSIFTILTTETAEQQSPYVWIDNVVVCKASNFSTICMHHKLQG